MHVFWGRTHINTGLIVSHVPVREKTPRHQKIPVFLHVPRILYCSLKRLYGVCVSHMEILQCRQLKEFDISL